MECASLSPCERFLICSNVERCRLRLFDRRYVKDYGED